MIILDRESQGAEIESMRRNIPRMLRVLTRADVSVYDDRRVSAAIRTRELYMDLVGAHQMGKLDGVDLS
jgi:hypothetical protein